MSQLLGVWSDSLLTCKGTSGWRMAYWICKVPLFLDGGRRHSNTTLVWVRQASRSWNVNNRASFSLWHSLFAKPSCFALSFGKSMYEGSQSSLINVRSKWYYSAWSRPTWDYYYSVEDHQQVCCCCCCHLASKPVDRHWSFLFLFACVLGKEIWRMRNSYLWATEH